MKHKRYTISQAIDIASKYTYKNRLSDILGYADSFYWKNHLGSYDKGRKKDFIVSKRKIDGKNYMFVSNIKSGKDYLWYKTNWAYKRK